MRQVFISHVEEDKSIAEQIARGLEVAGYTTWYYERDSLPGLSYLIQVSQALKQAQAVVLIISQDALGSLQVTSEVVQAYESRKPFMPVLRGITHDEFQRRQPEWRHAVGPATSISIPPEGVSAILPRIIAGLETLQVQPRRGPPPISPPEQAPVPSPAATPVRRPWPAWLRVLLPCIVTALLLGASALLKKDSEVEVSLQVSRVSFMIGERGPESLFHSVRLNSLRLLNFQQLELGAGELDMATATDPPSDWQWLGAGSNIVIIARQDFADIYLEDVTFQQLTIPPGSVITLASDEREPDHLNLQVDRGETSGSVTVHKVLQLSCDYCGVSGLSPPRDFESQLLRFTSGREHVITFSLRSGPRTMTLALPPGTTLIEEGISLAREIDFTQMDGGRRTSTLIGTGGEITFAGLKGKEVQARAGDFVILGDLQDGVITKLQIGKGIHLTLHGRVGKLATGPPKFVQDRLPSILEWLLARHPWMLYLYALVFVATTVLPMLTRLRLMRKGE
jgi:hypothetical protein